MENNTNGDWLIENVTLATYSLLGHIGLTNIF